MWLVVNCDFISVLSFLTFFCYFDLFLIVSYESENDGLVTNLQSNEMSLHESNLT